MGLFKIVLEETNKLIAPFRCKMLTCPAFFWSYKELQEHEKTVHGNYNPFCGSVPPHIEMEIAFERALDNYFRTHQ